MTLARLTALMSAVGKRRPDLVQDRNVRLFIQLCIEEAKANGPASAADPLDDSTGASAKQLFCSRDAASL